jgi:cellulose synthase/poly-beta-1,6-N-acetylglucosamine synthase-like glycosyltransferase
MPTLCNVDCLLAEDGRGLTTSAGVLVAAYLEEPTEFEGVTSSLDKFDDPNTIIVVSHDPNLALKRAPTFIDVMNRDSNVP